MLETFTGQKAFSVERSDPKLVCQLKSFAAFKECQDHRIEGCREDWANFLFDRVDTLRGPLHLK